jgi:hypothetical protein
MQYLPHSHNFCGDCNRVRATAEGRLLLCPGQEHSADLRRALRGNPTEDERGKKAIVAAMQIKPRGHDFDLQAKPIIFRHMTMTGGDALSAGDRREDCDLVAVFDCRVQPGNLLIHRRQNGFAFGQCR